MTFDNARWFTENTGFVLTDDQARCLEALCSTDNVYNLAKYLHGETLTEQFNFKYGGLTIRYQGSMSTFDCSRLTQLVLAAHRYCVRVEISPPRPDDDEVDFDDLPDNYEGNARMPWFEIFATPRKPEASHMFERHPDLDALTGKVEAIKPEVPA